MRLLIPNGKKLKATVTIQAKTLTYSVHTNFQLYPYFGITDPYFTSVLTLSGALPFFLFYLKHIKDMESNSIWGVISMCSNMWMNDIYLHTGDIKVYHCSRNMLPFLLSATRSSWRNYKGS